MNLQLWWKLTRLAIFGCIKYKIDRNWGGTLIGLEWTTSWWKMEAVLWKFRAKTSTNQKSNKKQTKLQKKKWMKKDSAPTKLQIDWRTSGRCAAQWRRRGRPDVSAKMAEPIDFEFLEPKENHSRISLKKISSNGRDAIVFTRLKKKDQRLGKNDKNQWTALFKTSYHKRTLSRTYFILLDGKNDQRLAVAS